MIDGNNDFTEIFKNFIKLIVMTEELNPNQRKDLQNNDKNAYSKPYSENLPFKNCRIIWNDKLLNHIKRIFDREAKKRNCYFEIGSKYISIVVNTEDIGKATCHTLIKYSPSEEDEDYCGELVTPIIFDNCKTIDDVLKAYTTDESPKYRIFKSFFVFFQKTFPSGLSLHHPLTEFLLDQMYQLIDDPQKNDVLFNIRTPKGVKKGIYAIFQKDNDQKTQIMIDMSNYVDIKLYQKDEGCIKSILKYFCCIFKKKQKKKKGHEYTSFETGPVVGGGVSKI